MSVMFSIIVATCDRPERLIRTLGAIRAAMDETGLGHQVIVADNGGVAYAKEVVALFRRESGLDVQYVESVPQNKSKALNTGIARATAEWLAFTDDDCLPDHEWLVNASKCVENSGWKVFGGRVLPGEYEGNLPLWLRPGRSGRIPKGGVFVRYCPFSSSGVLESSSPVPFGANFFVMRQVMEKYGGYDEKLWDICGKAALGVEDAELGIRLRNSKETIGYCHEALVIHPVNIERYSIRSHLRFSYYYGWRDPIVFFQSGRPFLELYRLKAIAVLGFGSLADAVLGDFAGMVDRWTGITRHWGAMTCRWSAAYRRMIQYT
ncbi:MAG: glycosyltransferase [Kiritimatiellae bacterium]|nr:glycosyltransferase [Kiritimatiellia bacterium]MDD5521893.1 glycosyltransferase [Kiritimatiellia bacterium]